MVKAKIERESRKKRGFLKFFYNFLPSERGMTKFSNDKNRSVLLLSPLTAFAKSLAFSLDGFNLYTVHKLSSKDETSRQTRDTNPEQLGGNRERYLCAMPSNIVCNIDKVESIGASLTLMSYLFLLLWWT